MGCCRCEFRDEAGRQFTAAKAAKELHAYRRGRLGATTRLLRDGIVEAGLSDGSLLDVGGGVGALTFELMERGITAAVVVDASAAYVAAAAEEAVRRGRPQSLQVVHADFVEIADTLRDANLVTLDRVLCCYPSYEPLLAAATRHAGRAVAVSYPRDRWVVRAATVVENARRARKSGFRTYVHSPSLIQAAIERAGFELARRRTTIIWAVDIYVRNL